MNGLEEIFKNSFLVENNIKDLPTSAGLVLFTDAQDKPITLLTAANIRRTVKNKLTEQIEKSKRTDLKSITSKIYYYICPCKFRLAITHYEAVKNIFADKYKDYITLVFPWFLTINFSDKIPFFNVTRKPTFKLEEKILGPFSSQKSATVFMTTLEDVFRLCRKSEFANNPQHAQSCPYLQMDSCCGVCTEKITTDEYKTIIDDAFSAGVDPENTINKFQIEMQTAAKELYFEKAAALKKKIEKLSSLKKQTYKWTGDLKNLKIIHVDKSAKIKPEGSKAKKQTYAVFAMNCFSVIDAGDFLKDDPNIINDAVKKSLEQLANSPDSNSLERFSIVTYFLYRSKPSGFWLNAQKEFDIEKLIT
jgi:excinuclease UvrABC nuclease subunit